MAGVVVFALAGMLLVATSGLFLFLGAVADVRSRRAEQRRQEAIESFVSVLFAEKGATGGSFSVSRRLERDALVEVVSTLPVNLGDDGRSRLRESLSSRMAGRTFRWRLHSWRFPTRLDSARMCGIIGSADDRRRLLADRHPAVRTVALAALFPDQVANLSDEVAAALLDPHPSVRITAAHALPAGGTAAARSLEAILEQTGLDRLTALIAAARLPDGRLLEALGRHAQSDHEESRVLAARAIANQNPLEAERVLLDMLHDEVPAVRSAAADGLARSGSHASLVPIRDMLSDPEWTVRVTAERALKSLGPAGGMLLRHDRAAMAEIDKLIADRPVPLPAARQERLRS
jgi:hypothetical protein